MTRDQVTLSQSENCVNIQALMRAESSVAVFVSLICLALLLIVYLTVFTFSLYELNFSSRLWKTVSKTGPVSSTFTCPFTGEPRLQICNARE